MHLRGGTYVLDETLVFGLEDSAVRYAAYQDEIPIITSLRQVSGWKKLSAPIAGLPTNARGKVWVARVEKGRSFKVLYHKGKMLPRARSKGFLPVRSEKGKANLKRLTVPGDVDLRAWEMYVMSRCSFVRQNRSYRK